MTETCAVNLEGRHRHLRICTSDDSFCLGFGSWLMLFMLNALPLSFSFTTRDDRLILNLYDVIIEKVRII